MIGSITTPIGKIFQPILDGVAAILAAFYSVIPNYPVDVALLTIVIMALLTPLTVKSTKSMAAMQALGPEMKKLQAKYKGPENRVQLNEEMMKLYKEHGVNPASGCLPLLLQFPAFMILYGVIRGITNTVSKGTMLTDGSTCHITTCADPRYISPNTAMYRSIVEAHGQLNSFGMDFAAKLLSHHSSLWAAIPYLVLVLGAVGLQYLQMSRLNARNPGAAQANPQAAMMQKYMPLIFGLIYLNVAALLNVYFIVSSAIRIGTQEVLFRRGMIPGPGSPPPGGAKKAGERSLPKATGTGGAKAADDTATGGAEKRAAKAVGGGAAAKAAAKPSGSKPAGGKSGTPAKSSRPAAGANGKGGRAGGATSTNGSASSNGSTGGQKPHPRSKSKRARKAR